MEYTVLGKVRNFQKLHCLLFVKVWCTRVYDKPRGKVILCKNYNVKFKSLICCVNVYTLTSDYSPKFVHNYIFPLEVCTRRSYIHKTY